MRIRRLSLITALGLLALGCSKDTSVDTPDVVCAAGEYSCQVRTLRFCNDSRTGWIEVDICGEGTRCDVLEKSCVVDGTGGSGGSGGTGGTGASGGTGATGGSAGTGGTGGSGGSAGTAGTAGTGGTGGSGGSAGTGGTGGTGGSGGSAGSAGTGGTGGVGGSAGSAGTGGSAGSAGTGGNATGCVSAGDCPGEDTECGIRLCVNQKCEWDFAPSGTQLSAQTEGDCSLRVCDGDGAEISVPDNTDIASDTNDCTSDICDAGQTLHPFSSPGTGCTSGGGAVCDGNGNCVECVEDADCPSVVCQQHNCLPLHGPTGSECPTQTCGAPAALCCQNTIVPGGTFLMGRGSAGPDECPASVTCGPDEQPEHEATVSHFYLDSFEVTVGRFRAFVDTYAGQRPTQDAGAHPLIPNSGWNVAWNTQLPDDKAEFPARLQCEGPSYTWTSTATTNEKMPMNCVSWYEAFAFCVWDGGRLPTEAEREYVAAGGAENRLYPWGGAIPTSLHAVFAATSGAPFVNVGSRPAGNGRWGHADLAGSMLEWTLDWYHDTWYSGPGATCVDCSNFDGSYGTTWRSHRGGAWDLDDGYLRTADRTRSYPTYRDSSIGFRCARLP